MMSMNGLKDRKLCTVVVLLTTYVASISVFVVGKAKNTGERNLVDVNLLLCFFFCNSTFTYLADQLLNWLL